MEPEPPWLAEVAGDVHGRLVHGRRVARLAAVIAPLLEPGWTVLDVGCGDGRLGRLLADGVEGVRVRGLESHVRPLTFVPVAAYDGRRLPVGDAAVDAVVLVDVLHHARDPMVLLAEARRVARRAVVIKDHRTSRPLAGPLLRFMDWVGNRSHGVALPYGYWSEDRWRAAWREVGLRTERYETRLRLYPWVARWAFDWGLHFVARLGTDSGGQQSSSLSE